AARETASQAGGGGGFPREGAEHGDPRHPAADPEGRLRDHLALRSRRGRGDLSHARLQGEEVGGAPMPDVVGWRKKFGVIVPSTNTVVEHDFNRMAPPGVT